MEVLERGKINKLENLLNDEKTKILKMFCNVWGAGPHTAEMWYSQGMRNLKDLRRGKLTRRQEIGLKLYRDLSEKIPRQEVIKIFQIIEKCVTEMNGDESSLGVELVGSYRRGKENCGDVDVMIVNHDDDDDKRPGEILKKLWNLLKIQGQTEMNSHSKNFNVSISDVHFSDEFFTGFFLFFQVF